jgi:hypothetical protein
MNARITLLVAAFTAASCAHAPGERVTGHSPAPVAQNNVTVGAQPPIADREEDLFPDPWDRTAVRMGAVRLRLNAFRESHGEFPDALADALPPGDPSNWRLDYTHDAWGTTIRYRRRGSDYDLVSPGADREFGTGDDIIVTSTRGTKWG